MKTLASAASLSIISGDSERACPGKPPTPASGRDNIFRLRGIECGRWHPVESEMRSMDGFLQKIGCTAAVSIAMVRYDDGRSVSQAREETAESRKFL